MLPTLVNFPVNENTLKVAFTDTDLFTAGGLNPPPQYEWLEHGVWKGKEMPTYDIIIGGKVTSDAKTKKNVVFTASGNATVFVLANGMILCSVLCTTTGINYHLTLESV